MATHLSQGSTMVAKTNKLIVAIELRIIRMTNGFSAQHNQRNIWSSEGGVAEDPLPAGIFSVKGVI